MQNQRGPKRPLPARVYWVRRALVLGTALLLVFGLARLLGGGSDGDTEPRERATVVSGTPTGSASPSGEPNPSATATAGASTAPSVGAGTSTSSKPSAKPLAQPDGPCAPEDITVTPTVKRQAADGKIEIPFAITGKQPACTWAVSNKSMVIRITSGQDPIWSSQECAKIPSQELVVRSAVASEIVFLWNGRRSDDNCSRTAKWALPGFYHVTAAALGGEPGDRQFELVAPSPKKVYETVSPSPDPKKKKTKPTKKPSASPSSR